MYLECTCVDVKIDRWNELMKGGKSINYKWLINKIKKHLPGLYKELLLDLYNPWEDNCRVTKTHYILVWSGIEYFIAK